MEQSRGNEGAGRGEGGRDFAGEIDGSKERCSGRLPIIAAHESGLDEGSEQLKGDEKEGGQHEMARP
jgi:hypothetical protein